MTRNYLIGIVLGSMLLILGANIYVHQTLPSTYEKIKEADKAEFTTSTLKPAPSTNWKIYSSGKYGFSFTYPENFNVTVENEVEAQFLLYIKSGTEEYALDITPIEGYGKYPFGTKPEGAKIISGNTWEILPSIPFCDAGICTNTKLMYQYTGKKYRYDFVFRNPTDLTPSNEKILATFKFTE